VVPSAAAVYADYNAFAGPTSKLPALRRSASTCPLRYAKALGQPGQRPCNQSSEIRLHETHQWLPMVLVSPRDASLSRLIIWPEPASDASAPRALARRDWMLGSACRHDEEPPSAAQDGSQGNTADRGHTRHTVAPGRGSARIEIGGILALTEKRRLFAPVTRYMLSCTRTHRCMRLRRQPGPQLFLLTGLPPVASRGPIPIRAAQEAPLITIGDLHRLAALSDDR
jgi:hypothetical protein